MVLNAVFVGHFCVEEWLSATSVWDTSFDTELGLTTLCMTQNSVSIAKHINFFSLL